MEFEKFTDEWYENLPDYKIDLQIRLSITKEDFIIMSENIEETLQYIKEAANALTIKVIVVDLKSREDIVGIPSVTMGDKIHMRYCSYEKPWWEKCADENAGQTSVIIFNIDNATDRLVSMIKSYVENHNANYILGFIYSDKTRDIEKTSIYSFVSPLIRWGEE